MIAASLVDTNVLAYCYLRSDGVLTSIGRIGLQLLHGERHVV